MMQSIAKLIAITAGAGLISAAAYAVLRAAAVFVEWIRRRI